MANENSQQDINAALLEELRAANVQRGAGADRRKERRDEASAKKDRKSREDLRTSVIKNTAELVGLTASMFTMKGILGDVGAMNTQLAKSLGQVNKASEGVATTLNRFGQGAFGMQQALDALDDAIGLGMSEFSDATLRFAANLKVIGVGAKSALAAIRFNTQALGITNDSSLQLVDSLVGAAAANRDSIEGLISALNSMKDALMKTTVELGPQAAKQAQEIAAMMSQGNTELQDAAFKFVSSFMAGTEGFMKAAKLGVQFTGEESLGEMVSKFETILTRIGGLSRRGPGSQFWFKALEDQLGITAEDFILQQQIGNDIQDLVKVQTNQLAEDTKNISISQAWQSMTMEVQRKALGASEKVALGMTTANKALNFIGLNTGAVALVAVGVGHLLSLTRSGMLPVFAGILSTLGKTALWVFGLWKMFSDIKDGITGEGEAGFWAPAIGLATAAAVMALTKGKDRGLGARLGSAIAGYGIASAGAGLVLSEGGEKETQFELLKKQMKDMLKAIGMEHLGVAGFGQLDADPDVLKRQTKLDLEIADFKTRQLDLEKKQLTMQTESLEMQREVFRRETTAAQPMSTSLAAISTILTENLLAVNNLVTMTDDANNIRVLMREKMEQEQAGSMGPITAGRK